MMMMTTTNDKLQCLISFKKEAKQNKTNVWNLKLKKRERGSEIERNKTKKKKNENEILLEIK